MDNQWTNGGLVMQTLWRPQRPKFSHHFFHANPSLLTTKSTAVDFVSN